MGPTNSQLGEVPQPVKSFGQHHGPMACYAAWRESLKSELLFTGEYGMGQEAGDSDRKSSVGAVQGGRTSRMGVCEQRCVCACRARVRWWTTEKEVDP